MTIRVAINGMGRVGRLFYRAVLDSKADIRVVAFNDLAPASTIQHLLKFDSTHGALPYVVVLDEKAQQCASKRYRLAGDQPGEHSGQVVTALTVDNEPVLAFQIADPAHYPWGELNVDVVVEATGTMRTRSLLQQHLQAGAKQVLLTSPGSQSLDADVVVGINEQSLANKPAMIACQSCTTNALAVVCKPVHEQFEILSGLMTEVHGYTADQRLLDGNHNDLRRARAAGHSMIPTPTAGAEVLGRVMPELAGKIKGYSMRVPTMNVAALDLTLLLKRTPSLNELNECLSAAAKASGGIMAINSLPLVSSDFIHNSASAIVDTTLTQISDNMVKIVAWYDNEWGYVNRLVDIVKSFQAPDAK